MARHLPKMSRREIIALAATQALAQTPPAPPSPPSEPDLAQAARDANKRNSEALAKFAVPIATEPAFRFQP